MRAGSTTWQTPDVDKARQYHALFARYRGFMTCLKTPTYCLAMHEASTSWLEALELLSEAMVRALEKSDVHQVEAIVREAGEAQIRLRSFQRTRARSLGS